MPDPLHGKVMVITGASSGIGAATALAAAECGMKVILNARRAHRLAELARRMECIGGEVEIVAVDVAVPGSANQILDAAEARFGRFDVVFANAGYAVERPAHLVDDTQLRRLFDVNFFAGADLLRLAAQRLLASNRRGHLLMCSSCLAKFTLPRFGAYCASKAAQAHFCRAMRIELADHGIEVSSVHPITTVTEFFEASARESGGKEAKIPDHAPKMFVQPAERVARAVLHCLRRPHSEVWTSLIVRTVAGFMTMIPPFMDVIMRREMKRLVNAERSPDSAPGVDAPPGRREV